MVDLSDIQLELDPRKVTVIGSREHSKASEKYIDVVFKYDDTEWKGSVPYEYRRTGTNISDNEGIARLLNQAYEYLAPDSREKWIEEEKKFWDQSKKDITRPIFDALTDFEWKCIHCEIPKNPNWARRFQDIKELGYTTATHTKMWCKTCSANTTHILLLPFPRSVGTGYENWTHAVRAKIIKVLNSFDVYEDRKREHLLPDHKFPEIRWDDEYMKSLPKEMDESEMKRRYQLINNQRNEQKREVCRRCFQSNKRGFPFGIKYYYEGDENWPKTVPRIGVSAEEGCIGCGWYDLAKWRDDLNKRLTN